MKNIDKYRDELMNIIQAKHFQNDTIYTYEVPKGLAIRKDTLLRVENKKNNSINTVIAVSDSEEVSENVLKMIMQGRKVRSKVLGMYTLNLFIESPDAQKPKFILEDYQGKYVMHCDTEEKARIFLNFLHKYGKRWVSGRDCLGDTNWTNAKMCYNFQGGVTYSDKKFYEDKDYVILEFDSFDWRQRKICEWVSVNDAVPHKTESVLYDIVRVQFDDGSYGLGVYHEGEDNEWWTRKDEGDMRYSTDRIVTRWCYLPEYLKEDNKNEV